MSYQSLWAYTTSALFFIASLILLLLPDSLLFLILSQSSDDEYGPPRTSMTHLETFLVTQLGLLTMAFSIAILFSMPIDSPGVTQSTTTEPRHPLLYPVAIASAFSALVTLKAPQEHMPGLYTLVMVGAVCLAIWSLWVILFGQSRSSQTIKRKVHRAR